MLLPHSSTLQYTSSRLACNTAHSCCWPGVDTGLVQISGGQGAGRPAHLPYIPGLPEVANICHLSFRCTKVSMVVTRMLKMDVAGRAGALHTQLPCLDTQAQCAVSWTGEINLSISVLSPEAASPSHKRYHLHHHCHMASVNKDKK